MIQYFSKPFRSFGGNINVKVDLSNYTTKTDLKNLTHVDTSSFALKANLTSLKTEVDKLDVGKLTTVPVDLSKLSDAVKKDVVKKAVYDQLFAEVNDIDTSDFVLKTKYQTNKTELEIKTPNTSGLVKKIDYNAKITEIEGKIPRVSSLATKAYKKLTDHNHDKYITTPEFHIMTVSVFNARLAQANLITKTDFDAKLSSLHRKITANKTKKLLAQNYSSYFIGKSHSEEDGTQNYLVFQPINKYFKVIANTDYVSSWKFKGLSAKIIKPPVTSGESLTPVVSYYGTKTRVKCNGSYLKQPKILYTHGKKVNIYIIYELGGSSSHVDDPTLKNGLFGAVTLTKNADVDNTGIQVMELDLIENKFFHFQVVDLVKM